MKDTLTTAAGQDTWREVIALLVAAADQATLEGFTNPIVLNTACGLGLATSAALELLPREDDHKLDQVRLDPRTGAMSTAQLLRAVEDATKRHPIEEFPVGASGVIVQIGDLLREFPR